LVAGDDEVDVVGHDGAGVDRAAGALDGAGEAAGDGACLNAVKDNRRVTERSFIEGQINLVSRGRVILIMREFQRPKDLVRTDADGGSKLDPSLRSG
jgi:hypothetical protein